MWQDSISGKVKIIPGQKPDGTSNDFKEINELTATGIVKPVIDHSYTFDQIMEAHRYVEAGHKKGNVVIIVQ